MSAQNVQRLYFGVIEEVINGVRDLFLDDGVDEQVLQELRQTWERKLVETKALDFSDQLSDSSSSSANNRTSSGNHPPNSTPRITSSSRNTAAINREMNQHATTSVTVIQSPITQANQQRPGILQSQSLQRSSTPIIATTQNSSSISRTTIASTGPATSQPLNYSSGIPQTLLQYTPGEGVDGPKTVTIMPQKLALAFNPQTSGLSTMVGSSGTTMTLPPELAASLLQQAAFNAGGVINITQSQDSVLHYTTNQSNAINNQPTIQIQAATSNALNQRNVPGNSRDSHLNTNVVQLDGPNDSSEDEEDEEDDFRENDEHEDNDDDQNDDEHEYTGEDEEPLNSGDDVSDEDAHELFDTDNVVVCQYDKITRSRNKWKFHLKDGIMNLQGKDYVFQKAIGDAEW